ncbi:MAG: lipopolysaccharide heptosyltransferase I [Phascolarctobacterium sp.]|nr:lipopolysaccharide heptosyltransferase I [Phascolarctobacterium sp.]
MQEYKNILLIKMSSLGDVLHTLPFAAELRKLYPKAKITWLVHPQFAGFVPDPPVIDEVIYFDKKKFNKMGLSEKWQYFCELKELLHSKHFDLVLDMQGLFKSAVMAAMSGCDNRLGYCELREGSSFVSKAIKGNHSQEHVIERYLDVARYLGADVPVGELDFPMPDLSKETESLTTKLQEEGMPLQEGNLPEYVVLVPGARWETKEWPPSHYAELAQMIVEDGRYVVLAGGPDDAAKGAVIKEISKCDQVIDMTGKTSLRELAALIKGCCVYISADTGPLHFAAALKKPLVAMYGPTKADRTGPYGSKNSTVLVSPAICAGCLKKHCEKWHCMAAIEAKKVFEIYKEKVKS